MYLQRWHGWCHMKLLPSRRVLCTPYNHAPCHFMQSHIRKVYACLAVTCHLRFWQNDRGLLRATAVTQERNGYRNKSQHRKLALEKKILPPRLLQGFCHVSGKTSVPAVRCWRFVTNNNGHPSITHTCMQSLLSNHTRHALTHALWVIHSRTRSLSHATSYACHNHDISFLSLIHI